MAVWKKIIVSGSSATLANLEVDSLSSGVVTGASGNLTTTQINGTGHILATTGASGSVLSGSFSGSFEGDGSGLTGIATDLTFSGSGATGGGDTLDLKTDTLTFEGGKNISAAVTNNTVTYNLGGGLLSGSTIGSNTTQGQVLLVNNGVSGSGITIRDLGTTDSPTFSGLTVTNDLTVDGDLTVNGTLTTINTTNTEIKDKFILLNSGSSNPDDGGLVVDEGGGSGSAFVFDGGVGRWGFVQTLDATTGSVETQAYVAAVLDEDDSDHDIAASYYQKRGNIKVDSSDDIWIYV